MRARQAKDLGLYPHKSQTQSHSQRRSDLSFPEPIRLHPSPHGHKAAHRKLQNKLPQILKPTINPNANHPPL